MTRRESSSFDAKVNHVGGEALSLEQINESFGFREDFHDGGKIAGQLSGVLPRIPAETLANALRHLPYDEFERALRDKLVAIVIMPGLTLYAACGAPALAIALADGRKVVAEAETADFLDAVRRTHGALLLHEATSDLATNHPEKSASRRLTGWQSGSALMLVGLVIVAFLLFQARFVWFGVSLLSGLLFLAVIALRLLCLFPPIRWGQIAAEYLGDEELPVYSVLVPLFRETSVLGQLLRALTELDYPALGSKRTKTA